MRRKIEPQKKHKGQGMKARYVIIPIALIFILVMIISIARYLQAAKDAQTVISVHNSRIETLVADSDMTDSSAA